MKNKFVYQVAPFLIGLNAGLEKSIGFNFGLNSKFLLYTLPLTNILVSYFEQRSIRKGIKKEITEIKKNRSLNLEELALENIHNNTTEDVLVLESFIQGASSTLYLGAGYLIGSFSCKFTGYFH